MKISDYIIDQIAKLGVEHIFYVSGGGAMHMNDSLGQHPDVEGICMLHEQGASIAAEAYARIRQGIGVCMVTSGPGGTNALTGLVGAYMDSIPVLFLSGQVKRADLRENAFSDNIAVRPRPLRQFGIQEVDILPMVKPYAKYVVRIDDPDAIRYEFEKAIAIATGGRPGPVWLDVPLDIHASEINPEELPGFAATDTDEALKSIGEAIRKACSDDDIDEVAELLANAKKPIVILGHGVRLSGCISSALELCEKLDIPIQTSWNGLDIVWDEHPLYFGRPGIVANRSANIILQQADLVITIGTRLCLLQTGFNYEGFLKNATHVMVDIDPLELDKKNVHPDFKICADAKDFVERLLSRADGIKGTNRDSRWLADCRELTERYPAQIPEQMPHLGYVSNYHLLDEISKQMDCEDIYQFTSSGTTTDIAMKMIRLKKGQRTFSTKALAAMGYDVPSCIGSCIASGGKRVICLTGDGSIAMNMQELEVIKRRKLPIKIFVSDNHGYAMIYGSEKGNFGRLAGCNAESGLTLPDMYQVASAFGIHTMHIKNENHLSEQVAEVLDYDGPVVCTVNSDITQPVLPKQANYMKEDGQMASRPLDDMAPLLSRDEYESLKTFV